LNFEKYLPEGVPPGNIASRNASASARPFLKTMLMNHGPRNHSYSNFFFKIKLTVIEEN